jgi:hypothetical protein
MNEGWRSRRIDSVLKKNNLKSTLAFDLSYLYASASFVQQFFADFFVDARSIRALTTIPRVM